MRARPSFVCVGTRIARPRLRSKQSPGRAIPLASTRFVTLDLPAANCIRSECRTSIARPYAASRKGCRDEHCSSAVLRHLLMNPVGTSIARPAFGTNAICRRQIQRRVLLHAGRSQDVSIVGRRQIQRRVQPQRRGGSPCRAIVCFANADEQCSSLHVRSSARVILSAAKNPFPSGVVGCGFSDAPRMRNNMFHRAVEDAGPYGTWTTWHMLCVTLRTYRNGA